MSDSVRQNVLRTIVGVFLAGNFVLAAVLWSPRAGEVVCMAATGALVAEPMLLAIGLGLGREPMLRRLLTAVGLSVLGAGAYVLGILLVHPFPGSDYRLGFAIAALFVVSGTGATILAGGVLRAHRFLAGVLTVEDDDGSQASSAPAPAPTSRELQFGVGYIIAMTSVFAIMISLLRLVAMLSTAPSWSLIFLMGWTFFFYSVLAAVLVVLSMLTTRHREVLAVLAVVYTLVAPLAPLAIVVRSGLQLFEPKHLINLYAYALSLSATIALVTWILRHLGYRLRHGWL